MCHTGDSSVPTSVARFRESIKFKRDYFNAFSIFDTTLSVIKFFA